MAATLVESWLPWWTPSSGNNTEATKIAHTGLPTGDPPNGPTSTETTSVWWSEWNFKVLFGWTKIAVFSTPETRGSLGTDGGWALYFVDKFGVLFFGRCWPMAGGSWGSFSSPLLLGLSGPVSDGKAAEEHAASDVSEPPHRPLIPLCNASQ